MFNIGIIGFGHVGTIMNKLFENAIVYDEPKNIGYKDEVNNCDISFVCVPTPMKENGECDTSIVEDVLSWLETDLIVIRSTVPVGFTEKYSNLLKKKIVFQPEYYGETVSHPFENPFNRSWITLGGDIEHTRVVAEVYKTIFNSEIIFNFVDSKTAELAKYMENSFLALKVSFCNQFYDLAKEFNVDYNILRETWLLDPRIGRSHTFVFENNRGYSGHCLPKDLASIIYQADQSNVDVPLLKAIEKTNRIYNNLND